MAHGASGQVVTLSLYRFAAARAAVGVRANGAGAPGVGAHAGDRLSQVARLRLGRGVRAAAEFLGLWHSGILAVWGSQAQARAAAGVEVFARHGAHAAQTHTISQAPLRATGAWDGAQPFAPAPDTPLPSPVAAPTRAAISPARLLEFWSHEPGIADRLGDVEGCLFKAGLGEGPLLRQITFSIWQDPDAVRAFAGGFGAHGAAARAARSGGYFSESPFARFAVIDRLGAWVAPPGLHLTCRQNKDAT